MAIKELVTLEGVEAVKASLNDLGKSGEQFLNQFKTAATSTQAPLRDFSTTLDDTRKSLGDTSTATQGFRDALHVLHPILQEVGIPVREFTGLTRAAGVGMLGLATAITGSVVIALAGLEDAAKKTKGELEDLFQSRSLGAQSFAALTETAHQLGTTVGGLAPGFESLTTAWQRFITVTKDFKFVAPPGLDLPPALIGGVNNLTTAYGNFIKILRSGRLDESDAEKTAKSFFDTLQKGGAITADALKQLPAGTVTLLAQAMGRGTESTQQFIAEVGLVPIQIDKLLQALGRFTEQSDTAFRSNAIRTYKDAFGDLLNTIKDGFKGAAGVDFSTFVVKELDRVRQGIRDSIDEWNRLKGIINDFGNFLDRIPFFKSIAKGFQDIEVTAARLGDLLRPGGGGAFGGTADEIGKIWESVTPPPDLDAKFKRVGDALGASFKTVPEAAKASIDQVAPAVETGMAAVQEAIGTRIDAALADIEKSQEQSLRGLDEQSQQAIATISSTFGQPIDFSPMTANFQSAMQDLVSTAQSIWSQIQAIFSNPLSIPNPDFNSPMIGGGFARGGLISGAGSTTSDSIWARLSDKEFVLNARAVQFYGSDLLYALNSMRIPRQVIPSFNMGGLVDAMASAIPRFASGGQVAAAGTPVTFVIDRQSFNMTASSDTVKALSRFAVNSQLASSGRKPPWYR